MPKKTNAIESHYPDGAIVISEFKALSDLINGIKIEAQRLYSKFRQPNPAIPLPRKIIITFDRRK